MHLYIIDESGYLSDSFPAQPNRVRPGEYLMPDGAITIAPEEKEGHWPHWNGKSWDYEKIPTVPEEIVNKTISHQSQTPHDILMRQLIEQFQNVEGYFVERGETDLSWTLRKKPEPTLEDVREKKLQELNGAHSAAENNAHVMSSLGFEIDANERAHRDIDGLITTLPDDGTTMFCDYNNEFHEVTKQQCQTLQKEIIMNAQGLYNQKWQYRTQIEKATSKSEIEAIVIDFDHLTF